MPNEEVHFPIDETTMEALACLKVVTGLIARRYKVCPLCLTFNMADIVADAEENGVVHHWGPEGVDPRDAERSHAEVIALDKVSEYLTQMLQTAGADGSKH